MTRHQQQIDELQKRPTIQPAPKEQTPPPTPVQPVEFDTTKIDNKLVEITEKLQHYDKIMLQLQSLTADHHLRIAALEKQHHIDFTSDLNKLKEEQTLFRTRLNQQYNRLKELDEMN